VLGERSEFSARDSGERVAASVAAALRKPRRRQTPTADSKELSADVFFSRLEQLTRLTPICANNGLQRCSGVIKLLSALAKRPVVGIRIFIGLSLFLIRMASSPTSILLKIP